MIHQRLMLMYPLSLSQKKTQRNLQGNNPKGEPKCKMESRKRKQILEDSSLESKSESTDEFSQQEESLTDPAQQQIMVFRPSSQPLDMDPAPKATAAALLMMAKTASYVPKELSLSSFSLGLIDSSQEETQTQEGVEQAEAQMVKSPETTILIEELDVLVEKIAKSGEKKIPDFPEGKTPPTAKQTVGQIFEKFETPLKRNLMSSKMKEKCYLWATRIRNYGDDCIDEYHSLCTLNAQETLVLSRVHFVTLKAKTYIEADIVAAMCLILNQQNIKRFQEEIYCLPPNIVNMTIGNHPNGEFLQSKSKKSFKVEDYPIYDCAIYVMKWLEMLEPQNVKKGKYEWDNWTQSCSDQGK
ncbi:uncharacterized protein DS421_10g307010 [Arachis hypogaea]|nr:uncharacterized protein DS421_10g307010 [Arachis hypogaea]